MSDEEVLAKIDELKARVKEIVQAIQQTRQQLEYRNISFEEFKEQKGLLEDELREILKRIAAFKERIQFSLRIQKESEAAEQSTEEVTISEKAKGLIYYFQTEFEEFINKASVYLSGVVDDINCELGWFELFYPAIAEKDKPFNVSGMLIQRGADTIKLMVNLIHAGDKEAEKLDLDGGITVDLPPETPKVISFQVNASETHIYSLRAVLLQVNDKVIDEKNYMYFDFEVKILPFEEIQDTLDFFDTKTGKYLIYSYLACDKEQIELFNEFQYNLKEFGVNSFEPLMKIIPGFKETKNLVALGHDITETIIFLIDNFQKVQDYYKYEKIDEIEKILLRESEKLFKFAPEGIILRPLENLENTLNLSMLFRSFFKLCKLGFRKLSLLKTILDIGKDYQYSVSKYFLYIKSVKNIALK